MVDGGQRATQLEEFQHIAEGLGADRYKEYDIAPFVEMVQARIPDEVWTGVFYSWLSLKGFLQAVHQLQRVEMFAAREEDGTIFASFLTVWGSGDSLAEWLRDGYPIVRMLTGLGVPEGDITMRLVRDYS